MKNTEGSKIASNGIVSSSGTSTSIGTDNAGNNFSSTGPLISGGASLKDHHNYSSSGKTGEMTSSSTHSSVTGAHETHNGNKTKRPLTNEIDNNKYSNNNLKMSETGATTAAANSIKGNESATVNLGSGEDTTTSTASKKPQFQFVSMEPIKDQRTTQNVKVANQGGNKNGEKNSMQLIEPAILNRILRLQKQNQYYLKSQPSGSSSQNTQSSYSNSNYYGFHNSPSKYQNNSNSSPQYYDRDNSYFNNQNSRSGIIKLDIDKIGICGIPSLWVSRDELIHGNHYFKDFLDEQERLERFLRILHCHKRYEQDKYYGGSIFKRGTQAAAPSNGGGGSGNYGIGGQGQSSVQIGIGASGIVGNAEFIWFSIENLAKLKINSHSAHKDDDLTELQMQIFPHIKSFDQAEALTFKILQSEAKLVRIILESHGFVQTDQNDWNILWTSTSSLQKQYIYENLHEYQRINHFLNASELTRKDRLCYNVGKMQQKFGKDHFDFLPETYILPDEFPEFQKQFQLRAQQQLEAQEDNGSLKIQNKNLWIVKPSSSSQGKGIFMVDEISEVPLNESLVISRYIDNPLLINNLKFDLRLYVLVTNFDPLKIYVYNEGLVRFASEPYNLETIKSNVYAHLTNYSINKKSENFVQNKNLSERDFGNKWSLSALQSHLERLGIDMKSVWSRIYDAIIKSLISVEGQVVAAIKRVQNSSGGNIKSNCFDLFGFDIILDSDLKPWILEVNLSPSLAFDSPLDFHIKSNLIVDALNIVGIRKFNRRKEGTNKHLPNGGNKPVKVLQATQAQNHQQQAQGLTAGLGSGGISSQTQTDLRKRLSAHSATQANMQSQSQLAKFDAIERNSIIFQNGNIDIAHMERLSKISAKHRELLREHLEEFCIMRQFTNIPGTTQAVMRARKHNFTRIFPAPGTNTYDMYFPTEQGTTNAQQTQKQYNKILYRYLYDKNSELQDILNQIIKSNDFLLHDNQRRGSQTRLKTNGQDTNSGSQKKQEESGNRNLERNDYASTDLLEQNRTAAQYEDAKHQSHHHGNLENQVQSMYSSTIDPPQINGVRTHSKADVVITSLQNQEHNHANGFQTTNNLVNLNQRLAQNTLNQVNSSSHQQQPRSQSSMAKQQDVTNGGILVSDFESTSISQAQSSILKTINVNNGVSNGLSPMNQETKKRIQAANLLNSNDNQQAKNNDYLSQSGTTNGVSNYKEFTPQKHSAALTAGAIQQVENGNQGRLQLSNTKSLNNQEKKPFSSDANNNNNLTNSYRKGSAGVSQGQTPIPTHQIQPTISNDGRIVVTGDDILIEYVRRIMNLIKHCQGTGLEITPPVMRKLELFICHKIWQPKEDRNKQNAAAATGDNAGGAQSNNNFGAQSLSSLPMWQRIERRFTEMGDRKRRLFIKKYQATAGQQDQKKNSESLEKMFKAQEKQKSDIVKDFSSTELELMLMQSNKNNPIEVVTLLLSLNSNTIGGTPSTTNSSLIYNSVNSQAVGYGGVLTKLEADATKNGVPKTISQTAHDEDILLGNERSFDNNGGLIRQGNGGSNNHAMTAGSKDPAGNRQMQTSMLAGGNGHMRQSNDNLKGLIMPAVAGLPSSSHSHKKDYGVSSATIETPNINGIKTGPINPTGSTYHTQSQAHSHNTNSLVGSNASLMSGNNFNKIGGGGVSTGGILGSNHLKSSTSKGKNQGSFDRSDIALQTGLALTQQQNKLGSILLNNQQEKKIVFPQINHNLNGVR